MLSIAEAERIRHMSISKSRTRPEQQRLVGSNTARLLLQPMLPRVAAESSEALVMISYLMS